jgi:hypothetical protein
MTTMRLEALAWFIDRLVAGDPLAWGVLGAIAIALGGALIQDLLANKKKAAPAAKRKGLP